MASAEILMAEIYDLHIVDTHYPTLVGQDMVTVWNLPTSAERFRDL